ncbi:MAG: hypothetical protein VB081_10090 [Christensenella sp.]|uniref:hypothetical protein n=1 Tax=Christensenella sp. TaxID=1935934 RepID=UPI002B1FD934|nr:hypothetical protein [Christensenella sp.]MEA5003836.1 hypothetical protein [Christensenella sp.]
MNAEQKTLREKLRKNFYANKTTQLSTYETRLVINLGTALMEMELRNAELMEDITRLGKQLAKVGGGE